MKLSQELTALEKATEGLSANLFSLRDRPELDYARSEAEAIADRVSYIAMLSRRGDMADCDFAPPSTVEGGAPPSTAESRAPSHVHPRCATQAATTAHPLDMEDFLARLDMWLERADMVLSDLIGGYLGLSADSLTPDDKSAIIFGYREYQIKACIVSDYLNKMSEAIQEGFDQCKRELSAVDKEPMRPVADLGNLKIAEQV